MDTLYRPGLWALLAVALVSAYLAGMSKVEMTMVALWVVVIWLAIEVDKIRDGSGKSLRQKYAKIIKAIEEGEVVEPKHQVAQKSGGFGDTGQMFYDFAGFADRVNHHLQWGGWRLQEDLSGEGVRNYTILFNGVKVGKLKLDQWEMEYRTSQSEISAFIEIWYARLFDYGSLRSFLRVPIALICADTHANFARATAEMEDHLQDCLWTVVKNPEGMPRLKMLIYGRPLAYFDQGEVRETNKRFWADFEASLDQSSDGQLSTTQN